MEDFGYQKNNQQVKIPQGLKRIFLVFSTLLSLAAFVYVTISAYYFIYQDKTSSDIEVIRSPEDPIKVIEEERLSEERNQIQVDHSIYEDIFGNKKGILKVENTKLRKPPEAILPPQTIKDLALKKDEIIQQKEEIKKEKIEQNKNTKSSEKAKQEIPNEKIVVYSDPSSKAMSEKQQKAQQDLLTKTEGKRKDNETFQREKTSNRKRVIRVQIAAMSSKEASEDNWRRLNRLHTTLFNGLDPFIEKIDLGKKGVFFRLQIGNFYNQIEAEEFCSRYTSQTQKSRADCIVVE